uniref:Calcineurin-like phosphoesterase domain-containing protein n=1 Tax=Amphora coffeiformis TaxID=265554 RepID=A0A7S3P227_9STRA
MRSFSLASEDDDDDEAASKTTTSSSTTTTSNNNREEGVEWTLTSHRFAAGPPPPKRDSSKHNNKNNNTQKAITKQQQHRRRWILVGCGVVTVLLLLLMGGVVFAVTQKKKSSGGGGAVVSSSIHNNNSNLNDESTSDTGTTITTTDSVLDNDIGSNGTDTTAGDESDMATSGGDETTSDKASGGLVIPPSHRVRKTKAPTTTPTTAPTTIPTVQPTAFVQTTVTAYAMGDLPYSDAQKVLLQRYMQEIPQDAAFVVHVGDMRSAAQSQICEWTEYTDVADSMFRSHAPVFMLVGDNDIDDCPNKNDGMEYWTNSLDHFWEHWDDSSIPAKVGQMSGMVGTWTFVQDQVLFIGVHLNHAYSPNVAGQTDWAISLIRQYVRDLYPYTGRVVMFGHSGPLDHHVDFFDGLSDYFRYELQDSIPLLYVQGDTHRWDFQRSFYGRSSWMKITVEGEAREAPTRLQISSTGAWQDPRDAFRYQRR